ncbi:BTB domain-containing protein [Caerostris darwini]|uniref:BTB domain-containing protein n=1 Tax=Caerostris darwini TaxID=1538125 RepID=A0AAV4QVF0_9ARAC|nr:BTB domain-containing protein [Caerostris darwini]
MSGSMCADSSRQFSWQSDIDYEDYTDNDSVYSGSGDAYLPRGPDISQRIRRLITDEVFTDVKFVVNCGVKPKPELRAHKAILAVGSQEFAKMLYSTSMQDPQRSTTSEFQIKNVPFEAFKNVVK